VAVLLFSLLRAQTPADSSQPDETASAAGERLCLGQEAMARRAFAEARDHFSRVLRLDWNNPQAYAWWCAAKDSVDMQIRQLVAAGNRNMAAGRYADAMLEYHQVLTADSAHADARRKFFLARRKTEAQRCLAAGLGYFLQGKYDSVRVMVDSALAFDPENSAAAKYAGQVETFLPQGASGKGLQQDPEAWAWHVEALKDYRAGDYHAAIALWEKILAKYPGHPDAVANIRQARLRLQAEGKSAEGIADGGK